jgi:N utilization substance protein B
LGDYKLEKIGLLDLFIMRLAIYEMFFDETPPPVMINEAVELAKRYSAEKSPSVVNAILDAIKLKELVKKCETN